MSRQLLPRLAALALLLPSAPLLAQAPPASAAANLNSTEVLPDHRVVFRIYAPNARAVSVNGEIDALVRGPMQKDERGVWSITLGPLAPDYYTYSFTVDGVHTADPRNALFRPGLQSVSNMFLLPGPGSAFQQMQAVPHGELRAVWYDSKTLGAQRRMHVYTPPGYERSGRRISGAVSPARQRRGRLLLGRRRPRERRSGQPDRGGKSQAHDRGDAERQHPASGGHGRRFGGPGRAARGFQEMA